MARRGDASDRVLVRLTLLAHVSVLSLIPPSACDGPLTWRVSLGGPVRPKLQQR